MELAAPAGCGETLVVPPLRQWPAVVKDNQHQLQALALPHGSPLRDWRLQARREVLALLGLATERADATWLMTGHQAEMYHPGVWFKNLLVDRACGEQQWFGLNITVDTDLATPAVPLPTWDAGLARKHVMWGSLRAGWPAESQPALGESEWRSSLEQTHALLERLPDSPRADHPCRVFNDFRHRVLAGGWPSGPGATAADSMVWARRTWEQPRAYREIMVSQLAGTEAFYRFVAAVLADFERFWQLHNQCLDAYRKVRGIRSAANPLPNLRQRETLWETPFWCMHPNGERAGLFVNGHDGNWLVQSKTTDYVRLDGDKSEWPQRLRESMPAVAGRSGPRPRALMLTMFTRLMLADIFVHGLGGARYDRITDALLGEWLGMRPAPRYVVASATACVAIEGTVQASETEGRARQRLRELHWNPQRFTDGMASAEMDALVAAKWKLIERIGGADRAQRRIMGADMRRLNAQLEALLTPRQRELQAAVERAHQAAAEREVLRFREYPYFLFRPDSLRQVLDASTEAAAAPHSAADAPH